MKRRKLRGVKIVREKVDVSPVSQIERELAVSRALSALCGGSRVGDAVFVGGSGVGQAPELPTKTDGCWAAPHHAFLASEAYSLDSRGAQVRGKAPELPQKAEFNFQASSSNFQKSDAVFLPVAPDIKSKNPKTLKPEEKFPSSKLKVPKRTDFRQATRSFLTFASIVLILISVAGFAFTFGPVLKAEINYRIKNKVTVIPAPFSNGVNSGGILSQKEEQDSRLRGNDPLSSRTMRVAGLQKGKQGNSKPLILPITAIKEVQQINFPATSSIVIPKIDATSEFFVNTDAANYDEYISVLQKGVAHAAGTALPGEVGNSYFFAHSAGNLFDVARFNAVFYLISNLEPGDAIYVSFGNQKFKYTVYDKKEVGPTDTEYLVNRKDNGRMLTLQTCTPPGTNWRRLLIFAKIEEGK